MTARTVTQRPYQQAKISANDRILAIFDFMQARRFDETSDFEEDKRDINDFLGWAMQHVHETKSQLFQDLWVQWELREKTGGYFCEFGATNGVDLSNTNLLEKKFGWEGLVVEPNPAYHAHLNAERQCNISKKCVFGTTGQNMQFNCTEVSHFSRLVDIIPDDAHEGNGKRTPEQIIEVETISLNDLLDEVNAPNHIDYISADTEGSEFEILSNFDFGRRTVTMLTVEHNYTPMREKIFDLLSSYGYVRRFEAFSQFDDWYIRPDLV
jgi:FkbM family methyltransferase